MKLQILLLSVFISSFNNNCKLRTERSKMPVETDPGQAQTSVTASDTFGIEKDTLDNETDTSAQAVHFGVMVSKTAGKAIPPERQTLVAKALGVNYMRARVDIKDWNGSNPAYDTYAGAGLKVLLNINYGIPRNELGEHDPIPFPTDMNAYSKVVNSVLDRYKPAVVVVENEEDNPFYHTGSADDYINMLKTAIQIAHSKGLKVTNGGITVREVCLIIYDDLVQRGEKQKAMDFISKAVPPAFLQRLNHLDNPQITRQIEFGRKILAAYKTLDLDYVNFHWYEPVRARANAAAGDVEFNPQIFSFVAHYLKEKTGKPVMTNEFGVLNASPDLVKNILRAVYDAKLSYAIFYSADGGEGKAVALQNAGGDLRENGMAFRDFIKQYINRQK
jgi:hypothetical protein